MCLSLCFSDCFQAVHKNRVYEEDKNSAYLLIKYKNNKVHLFFQQGLLTDIGWLWLNALNIIHLSERRYETECCFDEYALENGVGKCPAMTMQRFSLLCSCDTHHGEQCSVSRTSCEQMSEMSMHSSSVILQHLAVGKLF